MLFFTIRSRDKPDDEQAQNDFVRFVVDEVFPAIDTTATRVGQVSSIQLYNPAVRGHLNSYLLAVGGIMDKRPLSDAFEKLRARGAKVKELGYFHGRCWRLNGDGWLERPDLVDD